MVQERIYNYFERNPQLHVLFIFDRMDIIQTELGEVKEWADGYIYKVFDGAWFNTNMLLKILGKTNALFCFFLWKPILIQRNSNYNFHCLIC